MLDPFSGSGTTGQVSIEHGRQYLGIELNPEYLDLTRQRLGASVEKVQASLPDVPEGGWGDEDWDDEDWDDEEEDEAAGL